MTLKSFTDLMGVHSTLGDIIANLNARLEKLEADNAALKRFLPVIEDVFAGRVASEGSITEVMKTASEGAEDNPLGCIVCGALKDQPHNEGCPLIPQKDNEDGGGNTGSNGG